MTRPRTAHRRPSGSIRHLSSGSWQARYTGPDGALRTLGTFPTKVEADTALAHETSRMSLGTWHDPYRGQEQLGPWFRDWITGRADLADSTRALYLRLLATVIDAPLSLERPNGATRVVHIGAQTLASVTPAAVREWDSAVLADATRRATARWDRARNNPLRVNAAIRRWAAANGAPIAPTGRMPAAVREAWLAETGGVVTSDGPQDRNAGRTEAAQAYRLLHTGMAQAVADGLIPANPCLVKGASQRDSKDRTERRTATPAEIWALADAMPERYRAAVIVAFCSGLRAGELFALQRRHVDLEARTLRVEQSLARPGTGSGRAFSSTKTRAGRRTVALPAVAVAALTEHMARFTPLGPDSLVFGTRTGKPLSGGSRSMMFARARHAIGRDDLTWHDQRHAAMTFVASTGATLPELMERAGHASSRAALHYQHAADGAQRRIADRLDEALGRPSEVA
ncbi:site-specific integrase [Cellulomonas sp. WB94]|uniref:tyrosine-type recombinase/integrase n=1 Tax=Cellulomonas sp. WB94 TaxID=2173174 RepID=UPI000D574BF6|nr:tyrosine-type recombinase/integrase [Cellulomonas sp. WB94]PVU83081.1 site-specific integrase [Cellulomonas sp. WB94]